MLRFIYTTKWPQNGSYICFLSAWALCIEAERKSFFFHSGIGARFASDCAFAAIEVVAIEVAAIVLVAAVIGFGSVLSMLRAKAAGVASAKIGRFGSRSTAFAGFTHELSRSVRRGRIHELFISESGIDALPW